MGTVTSLQDFQLRKGIDYIAEVYHRDPNVLEDLIRQLTRVHNSELFRLLDLQIERLDKEIFTDAGIRFDLLQRKHDLVRKKQAVMAELNKE